MRYLHQTFFRNHFIIARNKRQRMIRLYLLHCVILCRSSLHIAWSMPRMVIQLIMFTQVQHHRHLILKHRNFHHYPRINSEHLGYMYPILNHRNFHHYPRINSGRPGYMYPSSHVTLMLHMAMQTMRKQTCLMGNCRPFLLMLFLQVLHH